MFRTVVDTIRAAVLRQASSSNSSSNHRHAEEALVMTWIRPLARYVGLAIINGIAFTSYK
jgi:hypothetical protein